MLRSLLVLAVIVAGAAASFRSPFNALLFYLWNAYFRPEDWVGATWVSSLRLSLAIYVVLLAGVSLAGRRPRPSLRLGLVGLFLAQALLSATCSVNPDVSFYAWTEFAKSVLIAVMIVTLVTDTTRFRQVFVAIALSLGLEAAKQGWVQLIIHAGAKNINTHPVLGDNNGVAEGMMMLIPIFAMLAMSAKKPWERAMHWFLMAGALARGLTTYSRGGFLAFGAVAFVWFMRSQRKMRTLVAIGLLAAMIFPLMPSAFWARMGTLDNDSRDRDESELGRLHFWETAEVMADAHPLTGIGFIAFPLAYDEYDTSLGQYGSQRAVHSVWFGLLAELGYPGPILFAAILACGFVTCRRVRRRAKRDPAHADLLPYALAIEMSLLAFVVAGTFLNSQYNEFAWHLIGLSIALDEIDRRAVRDRALQAAPAQPVRIAPATLSPAFAGESRPAFFH